MRLVFGFICCLLLSSTVYAKANYVDLRDVNLAGEVEEIVAPNVLKVITEQHGERRHFFVEIIFVDFKGQAHKSCVNSTIAKQLKKLISLPSSNTSDVEVACDRLDKLLDGKIVQVEVTEWSQPVLKGYVFLNELNINHHMIERGWYGVDYRQTRDANLAVLEKQARCLRVGIWESKLGIPEEDLKCQD